MLATLVANEDQIYVYDPNPFMVDNLYRFSIHPINARICYLNSIFAWVHLHQVFLDAASHSPS